MRVKLSRSDLGSLAALSVAWFGIWGAWISHRTVSLTQNAIYLADWSEVLTDVRYGPLAGVPNILRLAIVLAVVALMIGLGAARNPWLRWSLRVVASLPGLVLLPPYPYVLQLWRSDVHGVRFLIATALWVGAAACLLTDRLPVQACRALVISFGLAAACVGGWAFLLLHRPFEAHYAATILPGRGALAFGIGLMVAAMIELFAFIRHARQKSTLMV